MKDTKQPYHPTTEAIAIFSRPETWQFLQVSGPAVALSVSDIPREEGFVFAPFDPGAEPTYFVRGKPREIDINDFQEPETWHIRERKIKATDRSLYQELFEQALDFIGTHESEKIVLSARAIGDSLIPSIPGILTELREAYPTAFVYAFYLPDKEFWIGATPELLWETTPDVHRTVALAGTMQHGDQLEVWGGKERLEHRYVEWFVEEQLGDRSYTKSGPRPVKAGPIYHLKTEYEIALQESDINPVDFHPGPALSGYPVPSAVRWIIQKEHEPRRYYTGFLGPVTETGQSALYINLRCVEILQSGNVYYAGGGLTSDSNVDSEWNEIQDKLSTLRSKFRYDQETV